MMKVSNILALAVVAGGLALQSTGASAMPMVDVGPAVTAHADAASGVQEAYWRHGFYGHRHFGPRFGFYGPRPYYGYHPHYWHRPWGWRRPFYRHYY